MPFAVQLFFDPISEAIIRNAQEAVANSEMALSLHTPTVRPSLLLALYDEFDSVSCESRLKMFAEMFSPFALAFPGLGVFPGERAVIYLAPTVNQKLLDIHAYVHQLLKDGSATSSTRYIPGNWIPHCALAVEVEPTFAARTLEIGMSMPFPMQCQIEEIGVMEYWPAKHLYSFHLGGG